MIFQLLGHLIHIEKQIKMFEKIDKFLIFYELKFSTQIYFHIKSAEHYLDLLNISNIISV